MISPQSFAIADVGCDHAYVAIALCQRQLAKKVIAMDVRRGPLAIAKNNVVQYGLGEEIELRLGDGLEELQPGEVDTIIIAGMGGLLMRGILERGYSIWTEDCHPVLVLQPQSDIGQLRHFLYEKGYMIEKEKMLLEEGKYYTVMRAIYDDSDCEVDDSEAAWTYGACNLRNRDAILLQYLKKESCTLHQIQTNLEEVINRANEEQREVPVKTLTRFREVQQQIRINTLAQKYYQIK